MSRFLSRLQVEEMDEDGSADQRGSWRLLSPLAYQSDILGRTVTVPAGFITDFASTPRIPVIYELAGNVRHKAAVIHDNLYTVQSCDRETADAVLREAIAVIDTLEIIKAMADGAGEIELDALTTFYWIRRNTMFAGVRIGGASHWVAPGQEQSPNVQAQLQAA
jgi:hypothetical protein